jgi:hypothetical protein
VKNIFLGLGKYEEIFGLLLPENLQPSSDKNRPITYLLYAKKTEIKIFLNFMA